MRFTSRSSTRYPHRILEKNHFVLLSKSRGKGKPENSVLLNKSGTQGKLINQSLRYYQSLTDLGKENTQLQPTLAILYHLKKEKKKKKLKNSYEAHSPEA